MSRFLLFAVCILLISCGAKKQPEPEEAGGSHPEQQAKFIPFTNMLREDLKYIDSAPLPLAKYTRTGKAAVTGMPVTKEEVKQLAAIFMEPDFNQESGKRDFTETTYADATTNTFTFSYECKNTHNPVRKVFLNFSGREGESLSLKWASIQRESGDTIINLYWKRSSHFLIAKSWPAANGQQQEQSTRVGWDGSFTVEGQEETTSPGN